MSRKSPTAKAPSKSSSTPARGLATRRGAHQPTSAARRIQVRRSGVHGKGVFAVADIPKGEVIIEYVGEVITWKEALRRNPHDPSDPNHTFYFHIDEDHVIDALYGGNSSRWINHSCSPNCEPDEIDGRIFIRARKNIQAGDELSYDYGLVIDAPLTEELKADYPCWCGSKNCRGTLLSSSIDEEEGAGKGKAKASKSKADPSNKKREKK